MKLHHNVAIVSHAGSLLHHFGHCPWYGFGDYVTVIVTWAMLPPIGDPAYQSPAINQYKTAMRATCPGWALSQGVLGSMCICKRSDMQGKAQQGYMCECEVRKGGGGGLLRDTTPPWTPIQAYSRGQQPLQLQ